jgi:hypothetical protein
LVPKQIRLKGLLTNPKSKKVVIGQKQFTLLFFLIKKIKNKGEPQSPLIQKRGAWLNCFLHFFFWGGLL